MDSFFFDPADTTVVADNLSSLPALAPQLYAWGVRRWNLQVVTPFGRGRSEPVPAPRSSSTAGAESRRSSTRHAAGASTGSQWRA